MNKPITLKNVRLSFPDLFVARPFQAGDEPRYKATFLIPKGDPQIAVIKAAIAEAAEGKWGKKGAGILKAIEHNPNKNCFQDGDNKEYDGYAGNMSVSAAGVKRPAVIDRDTTTLSAADGKPYAGCYVNASVEFFGYETGGNGVSANLRWVQFVKDGEGFGGGTPVSQDEFESLGEEEDSADDLL